MKPTLIMGRTYVFTIHKDLRPHRLRPFWATGTLGIGNLGDAGGCVWRARTRERLEEKVERWAKRDALRRGITEPIIEVA